MTLSTGAKRDSRWMRAIIWKLAKAKPEVGHATKSGVAAAAVQDASVTGRFMAMSLQNWKKS